MRMKKIVVYLLMLAMVFCFVGCTDEGVASINNETKAEKKIDYDEYSYFRKSDEKFISADVDDTMYLSFNVYDNCDVADVCLTNYINNVGGEFISKGIACYGSDGRFSVCSYVIRVPKDAPYVGNFLEALNDVCK